jgi:hypothetical protein
MVPATVGIVSGVVAVSWHAGIVPVGLWVVFSALVVVVQVSWRAWGIFCAARQPKLAISSSTDNRKHSKDSISQVHRVGCNTLPRPTVVAVSVGAAHMRAAATAIAGSVAVAAAIARRRTMPALVHGGGRKIEGGKWE